MTKAKIFESSNRLELYFRKLATACYDHPKTILFAFTIMAMLAISYIPRLAVDMSAEAMLHKTDKVRTNYTEFKETFGSDNIIILSIPTEGKLDNELLQHIVNLHLLIEENIPYISKVTSLINARHTYGDDNELIVEDLLENWPYHRWTEQSLKDYVLSQDSYKNRLISKDGKHTAILIELKYFTADGQKTLTQKQISEAVISTRDIVDNYKYIDIAMAGRPVIQHIKNVITTRDSGISGGISLLVTIIFLAFFFRRWSGVLMPMLVIYGSIIGAAGLMSVFESPLTLTISVVFPLMMAVGVADSVHILTHFYQNYEEHGNKRSAIIEAISHAAPAVLLTSLTTAAGFISFTAGDLASTADLGIYAASAVMLALLFTVVLLPALLALFNIRRSVGNQSINIKLGLFLNRCTDISYKHANTISFSAIAILLASIFSCGFLYFSYDPIHQFPDSIIEKQDHYAVDSQFSGSGAIEVIIDSGKENGIYDPDFIRKVERASAIFSNTRIAELSLANTYSVLNILREINRALNGNDDNHYRVPTQRDLIAQEILLFEISNRDDLLDVVSEDYRKIRLTLKVKHDDAVKYEVLVDKLEQKLKAIFPMDSQVVVTGNNVLSAESVPKALRTMTNSYIIAAILVIVMMMLVVQNGRIGLISIIPNLLPIFVVLSLMVIMEWPLDMATIMFGAIAMGIVVDDTLHFLYHFKLNYDQNQNTQLSISKTLKSTGPALFITTIIFSTGAASNMLSSLDNIFAFGMTMWLATVLALLCDLLITPALLFCFFGKTEPVTEAIPQLDNKKLSQYPKSLPTEKA